MTPKVKLVLSLALGVLTGVLQLAGWWLIALPVFAVAVVLAYQSGIEWENE